MTIKIRLINIPGCYNSKTFEQGVQFTMSLTVPGCRSFFGYLSDFSILVDKSNMTSTVFLQSYGAFKWPAVEKSLRITH